MPCLGRHISLLSFRAEILHQMQRRGWNGMGARGLLSPPARAGRPGVGSRQAAPRAGTVPAASLAHPCLGEISLLPRLSSSGPTQRRSATEGQIAWLVSVRLARGWRRGPSRPRVGSARSSCLGEIRGFIPLQSRGPAASSPRAEDAPRDRGGGSALSNGCCWQFIRHNYAN